MMILIGEKLMSWINDVKYELGKLEVSKKSLRKFGITVGIVFLILAVWFYYSEFNWLITNIFGIISSLLILFGLLAPINLKTIYKIWMTLAFALGWIMSRVLLTFIFIIILTPIGILGKLFRKQFLYLKFQEEKKSFWIKKDDIIQNYKKMY